jgi:flagellar biosynthesis/type III secretory pathway protein FliH
MSDPIVISLSRPITSVTVLDDCPASVGGEQADYRVDSPKDPSPDLEAQKAMFTQACQTLNGAAAKLNEFYDKVLVEHREEIAKLSVEIARKILVQKVENGDYEIESIIKEALKNAPSRHDVVVHLNPEDHARCRKGLRQEQDEKDSAFAGVKFVSNPNIGRAECLLETPKGVVKSLIDENLERISQALKKAE